MPVYGICTIRIEDRKEFGFYERGFMEIFEKFDSEPLAVDETPKVKEGAWPSRRCAAVTLRRSGICRTLFSL